MSAAAIGWTVGSVICGAVGGFLVDQSMQRVLPINFTLPLTMDNIMMEMNAAKSFPDFVACLLNAVQCPINLVFRAFIQAAVGVFTLTELTSLYARIMPSSAAPIGDGALMFWFFLAQPLFISNVILVGLLGYYYYIGKPPLPPNCPTGFAPVTPASSASPPSNATPSLTKSSATPVARYDFDFK